MDNDFSSHKNSRQIIQENFIPNLQKPIAAGIFRTNAFSTMTPAHLVMKTAMMKPHAVARDFEVAHLHHLNSSVALNILHFSFFLLEFFYDNVVANRCR